MSPLQKPRRLFLLTANSFKTSRLAISLRFQICEKIFHRIVSATAASIVRVLTTTRSNPQSSKRSLIQKIFSRYLALELTDDNAPTGPTREIFAHRHLKQILNL